MLPVEFVILFAVTAAGVLCWYLRISHKYVIAGGLVLVMFSGLAALSGLAGPASDASLAALFVLAVGIVLAGIRRFEDLSDRELEIPLTDTPSGKDRG